MRAPLVLRSTSAFEPPSSSERLVRACVVRKLVANRLVESRVEREAESTETPRRRGVDVASSSWLTSVNKEFRKMFPQVHNPTNGFSRCFEGEVRSEAVTTSKSRVVTDHSRVHPKPEENPPNDCFTSDFEVKSWRGEVAKRSMDKS